LFDRQGVLVFRSTDAPQTWSERVLWLDSDPVLQRALGSGQPQTGVMNPSGSPEPWISARIPIADLGWVAGAGRPLDHVLAPVRQLLWRDLTVAVVVCLLALMLANAVARTIAQPLRRLERDASLFASSVIEPDPDVHAPKEVRQVRRAVEAMATDLRAHALALRDAHLRLTEAERLSHTGAWEWDVANDRWHVSAEWCAIHGLPQRTYTSAELTPLVAPEDRPAIARAFADVRGGRGPFDVEQRIVRQNDGAARIVRAQGRAVQDDTGRVARVYGFAQDITEQKLAEEALRRTADDLQRMNTELEQFAYVASHDLKAPLRAVANLAYVIDEEASGELDPENRHRLHLLRERVMTMDQLIEGLLAYSRAGRAPQDRSCVALAELIRELVDELDITKGGFQVHTVEPLPTLFANPIELRQIFQNLLVNAVEHHDRPGEGHAWIRASDGEKHWTIEIADDGPGIPESKRQQVFRMFSTGVAGSTGIGLAIACKLVIANGGRIDVAGNIPRGAAFRIVWPKTVRTPSR
jgi:PAS domain S-box-containing protein